MIRLAAVAFVIAGCAAGPLPTASQARAPVASTPTPTVEPTASASPWVACGAQVQVGDSTGRLQSCEDLGTMTIDRTSPHVTNEPFDPSRMRIWWAAQSCVSTWWIDIHDGANAVVIDIDDGDHVSCPGESSNRVVTLSFRPMVQLRDVVQLHNGMPVISMWPVRTPTPPARQATYPSTPASIQFGRWELAAGENLNRKTTEIHVVVFEKACASGLSPEGRILEPFIAYDERYVWIAFAAWSLAGVQTCEPGPGVPHTVQMRELLGRRHIEDGARIIESWGFFRTDCPFGSPQNPC